MSRYRSNKYGAIRTWGLPDGTLIPNTGLTEEQKQQLIASSGILFASKREAERFRDLLLLSRTGHIKNLQLQPAYPLEVNGQKITPREFKLDFQYDFEGETIVEDVKGQETREWKVKWNLVKALYPGIKFKVVK